MVGIILILYFAVSQCPACVPHEIILQLTEEVNQEVNVGPIDFQGMYRSVGAKRVELVREKLHASALKVHPDVYNYDERGWNEEIDYGMLYIPSLLEINYPGRNVYENRVTLSDENIPPLDTFNVFISFEVAQEVEAIVMYLQYDTAYFWRDPLVSHSITILDTLHFAWGFGWPYVDPPGLITINPLVSASEDPVAPGYYENAVQLTLVSKELTGTTFIVPSCLPLSIGYILPGDTAIEVTCDSSIIHIRWTQSKEFTDFERRISPSSVFKAGSHLEVPGEACIYDADGRKIITSESGYIRIPSKAGIYYLKAGKNIRKILVLE